MHLNNTPYFIVETAFHHEGDANFLLSLINSFEELNVHAIKFHLLFDVDDYIVKNHPAIDVLKKISIPKSVWDEVFKNVKEIKKDIVLLCNDIESLKWVNQVQEDYPITAIELHSSGLNDIFLLHEALNFKKTIILGVGGSTFDEIKYAIDFLRKNSKTDIILIHGFQNYPTNYGEINFKRIPLLQQAFNLPVGYADHTDPGDLKNAFVSVLPQMLGSLILEKHVTNVFGEKRIDAQAAVSIETMSEIIDLANEMHATLGDSSYEFSEAEKNYGNTGPIKKAIVARRPIVKGEKLTLENIAYKRTEISSPILQKEFVKILGAEALKNIEQDEILSFSNVSYQFKKENFDQFFVSEK